MQEKWIKLDLSIYFLLSNKFLSTKISSILPLFIITSMCSLVAQTITCVMFCIDIEMRESFHILDTDCDGLVSRAQVENLVYRIDPDMTHGEMADLLDTADLDGMRMQKLMIIQLSSSVLVTMLCVLNSTIQR